MYRSPHADMPHGYYDTGRCGPYLGELHSIKVYEMHIFKDYTETWKNPTVHAFPIEPDAVHELISPVSLRILRRLPADQLAFLSKHLKEMNEDGVQHPSVPAPAPASAQAKTTHTPVPAPDMSNCKSSFENLEASTMIYTPSGPETDFRTRVLPTIRLPPPPPTVPTPFIHNNLPKPTDISKHCLTPWKLESIDFDVVPSTLTRQAPYQNTDYQNLEYNYYGSKNLRPIPSMEVSIKSYEPGPLAYQEFTAIYSRWIPSRADDSVKHGNNGGGQLPAYQRRPQVPLPVQISYSRAPPPPPVGRMSNQYNHPPRSRNDACSYGRRNDQADMNMNLYDAATSDPGDGGNESEEEQLVAPMSSYGRCGTAGVPPLPLPVDLQLPQRITGFSRQPRASSISDKMSVQSRSRTPSPAPPPLAPPSPPRGRRNTVVHVGKPKQPTVEEEQLVDDYDSELEIVDGKDM